MKCIFAIVGNDGTGKSSVCKMINLQSGDCFATERSTKLFKEVDCSVVDHLTLMYTFDKFRDEVQLVENVDGKPVYWILLDCETEKIAERMKSRNVSNVWETPKALSYFRNRYLELAAYYGIPVIDTTNISLAEVVERVLAVANEKHYYEEVKMLALKNLTYDVIKDRDVENIVYNTNPKNADSHVLLMFEATFTDKMTENEFLQFRKKLYSRWICEGAITVKDGKFLANREEKSENIDCAYTTVFRLMDEGESKKIFKIITRNPYLQAYTVIVLKSTIYSHSMQATGEIEGLSKIRATGTQIFLEMMNRNGLSHTYQSINNRGVIFSRFLESVPPTEIVVKKYCEGTDKHSYYGLAGSNYVLPTGEYQSGPYVRFDWRNPNHIFTSTGLSVNQSSAYYICEETIGKERFFELVLKNRTDVKPFGDKSISEDLLGDVISTTETKKTVLKMFMTIQYYFRKIGLEIKDVCFMLDKTGQIFWSEINQDCMRIKTTDTAVSFDKDIWRAGGSSSKEALIQKWLQFNQIMVDYFNTNSFHTTELIEYNTYPYQEEVQRVLNDERLHLTPAYKSLYKSMAPKKSKRVILTMDLFDGSPVLVKSGKVYTTHTNGNYKEAMEKISIFSDVLVVDLNGAFGEPHCINRKIVKELAQKYYIHSGGGMRTIEDVQDVLQSSARRIVVSSACMENTEVGAENLIDKIPKDRLIVELSVNEFNEVLIHGRKTNTKVCIYDKLLELSSKNVEAVSVTFHCSEGHLNGLPRNQIRELMLNVPRNIQKVIIAGGISSLSDLNFLWSFDKIIPQLGSAIWTNTISVGDVYSEMINFDEDGKIPAIIQDTHGRVKGQVYVNSEAIKRMCEERVLYRYSRESKKLMKKGDTSNNIQHVYKLSLDCDSDSVLITVDTIAPFCHTGNYSCFSLQTVVKANLNTLTEHVKGKMDTNSYSGLMQKNPGLALSKLMEEFWELMTAYDETQVSECSDLLIHLLMYMNGKGISIEDILNELNARRWDPRLTSFVTSVVNTTKVDRRKEVVVAVTAAKYSDKTDKFTEDHLGFKIIRTHEKSRSMKVTYEVVDKDKFEKFCGDRILNIITSRPKDMPWLLASGRVTHAVTYETVVKNFPEVYVPVHEIYDPDIGLALICRKSDNIDILNWSSNNKVLIAAEHVWHVSDFFHKQHISPNVYHMDRIMGSSEGFLINTEKYLLCDAVVESGKTLEDNDLKVWQYMIPKGQVKMGLYAGLI